MEVRSIPHHMTKQWLTERHYARRMPAITYAFGLFHDDALSGVCTYGPPARQLNNGYGIFGGQLEVPTFELNRLVIADDLPDNSLSRFVAGTFRYLPHPCCLVSYADANHGHHGYIYQATNWIYTGTSSPEVKYINKHTGKDIHARTVVDLFGSRERSGLPDWVETGHQQGKYRYVMFIGSKRQRRQMRQAMVYDELPYPKGNNRRYETTPVAQQGAMF